MPALLIRSILLAAVFVVPACERGGGPASPPAAAAPVAAGSVPAGAPSVVAVAATTPAAVAPATGPALAAAPAAPAAPGASRCDAPVRHADMILRTTGAPSLVAVLMPAEQAIASCEREQWPDEVLACSQTATNARGLLYDCYTRAWGDRPLAIKRRFNALEDNRAADPPAGTIDGDYIAIDAKCGSYTRLSPPAYGMYYVCGDDARGPFMTPDDIQQLFAALSRDEASRHKMVMDLVDKAGGSFRKVDVYQGGVYQGTRTDF